MRYLTFLFLILGECVFSSCKHDSSTRYAIFSNPLASPSDGPAAGYSDGNYPIPLIAGPVDVTQPDQVVGDGTPESCTCDAFVAAVAKGGKIVFNGGSSPFTIKINTTAKILNDANSLIVIDGKGLVTLSGDGFTRILYMNTCDPAQHWTTSHCENQEYPQLVVQNITFANGNSAGDTVYSGGGAIYASGGSLKVVNCRFFNNQSDSFGPDVGGGAIRAFNQYNNMPIYIVNCTFGGATGFGNFSSNGGAVSSIGVSWTMINCLFSYNRAIGNGGNPASSGTPGGGSGGAIYNDGNTMTLSVLGSCIESNHANTYGSAIFFVSDNLTGNIRIDKSIIENNSGGSWYPFYSGISMESATPINVTNSVIQ